MIKPTVGRVVHFYVWTTSEGRPRHEGPYAAHVAKVNSDHDVNLMVIDEDGIASGQHHVLLVQDGEKPPQHNYCCWMPYQVGQAAKTEQAEKVAEAARKGFHEGNR